jgi:hypothetical protein
MKLLTIFVFFSLSVNPVMASNSCDVTSSMFAKFMRQDYWTFDQTKNGWRGLDNGSEKCTLAMAQLIDSYQLSHTKDLKPSQSQILYWHAGQNLAFLDIKEIAISRFSNSFDPLEPEKPDFHWNAYARATIAFLLKDKAALLKARDEFSPVAHAETANFNIVERFIRCPNSSYLDAYGGIGTCPK